MSLQFAPLIAALCVMVVSLAGVVFAFGSLSRWAQRYLTYLTSFAGGVFVLVTFHLLIEASEASLLVAGLSIAVGFILMESINFFLPEQHHHHEAQEHSHTHLSGRRVLASDALHNVADGILLVAAFAVDWRVGIAATAGVLLHELVQEISEFFLLREAGYRTSQALFYNLCTSATIFIGVFIASFFSSELLTITLSGIAAGGFSSLLARDLLPHAIASIRTHGRTAQHVVAFVLGAILMLGTQLMFPHEEHAKEHENVATTFSTRHVL